MCYSPYRMTMVLGDTSTKLNFLLKKEIEKNE